MARAKPKPISRTQKAKAELLAAGGARVSINLQPAAVAGLEKIKRRWPGWTQTDIINYLITEAA